MIDPNAPWNPSQDPMDMFGKNRAGAMPPASAPFQPVPNPFITNVNNSSVPYGQGVSLGQAFGRFGQGFAGDFLLNVIAVGVLSPVWVCLYPLSALAGAFTFFYAYPFLLRFVPRSLLVGQYLPTLIVGSVVAAVVLWTVSRFESVIAANGGFRIARHVVRLPLLGLLTILAIERTHGLRYNFAWPLVSRILSIPQYLAIVIGAMVAAHFVLWNWKWAREFWHRRLRGARLRTANA